MAVAYVCVRTPSTELRAAFRADGLAGHVRNLAAARTRTDGAGGFSPPPRRALGGLGAAALPPYLRTDLDGQAQPLPGGHRVPSYETRTSGALRQASGDPWSGVAGSTRTLEKIGRASCRG